MALTYNNYKDDNILNLKRASNSLQREQSIREVTVKVNIPKSTNQIKSKKIFSHQINHKLQFVFTS